MLVRTDAEVAKLEKIFIFGELIQVQQQLFGAGVDVQALVGRPAAAVVARILGAGFGALIIQPGALGAGQAQIGLPDAPTNLLKQLFAKLGMGRHPGVGVLILRLQILDDLWCVALLEPAVGIFTGFAAGDGLVQFRTHGLKTVIMARLI